MVSRLVRNISPDGRYIVFESGSRGWDIEVLDRGSNIELDIRNGAPASGSRRRHLNTGALVKHAIFYPQSP